MANTTNVHSINFGHDNTDCGNIRDSFNANFYNSDEDAQIVRWLSPLEPNNRHQCLRTDRFGSVGGWLLEASEFREWRGGDGGADKACLILLRESGSGQDI